MQAIIRCRTAACRLGDISSIGLTHRRLAASRITSTRRWLSNTPRHSIAGHDEASSTILALSTASGRSAIAVVRVSGPACLDIYRSLCPGKPDPKPRYAILRRLYEPGKDLTPDNLLDAGALVLYFPSPNTVTGEEILELHVHGGSAIVQAVLRAIPRCQTSSGSPIRFAEPGEFTKRAFWNNKLDLTQVEALGDMLSASTEQQRKLSVRGTSGALSKEYNTWRTQLLYARGELEALIDFSEDQHFDESASELLASVAAQIRNLLSLLRIHTNNAMRGELLRNGISISLLGAPNAGKSSLLNRIVGREAAIVSREAGTTRDIVEVGVDIDGYYCRFGDTAGIRGLELAGDVEREGIRRAKARAADSDVVIIVFDFELTNGGRCVLRMDDEVTQAAAQLMEGRPDGGAVVVLNKADLVQDAGMLEEAITLLTNKLPRLQRSSVFVLSCVQRDAEKVGLQDAGTNNSIQAFLNGLSAHFRKLTTALSPDDLSGEYDDRSIWLDSLGATERHRLLIDECIASLEEFMDIANTVSDDEADIVVAAEHLRSAADCLARITGRGEAGDVEEVLGVVFEKFCVGK